MNVSGVLLLDYDCVNFGTEERLSIFLNILTVPATRGACFQSLRFICCLGFDIGFLGEGEAVVGGTENNGSKQILSSRYKTPGTT